MSAALLSIQVDASASRRNGRRIDGEAVKYGDAWSLCDDQPIQASPETPHGCLERTHTHEGFRPRISHG